MTTIPARTRSGFTLRTLMRGAFRVYRRRRYGVGTANKSGAGAPHSTTLPRMQPAPGKFREALSRRVGAAPLWKVHTCPHSPVAAGGDARAPLLGFTRQPLGRHLEGAGAEQEVHDVAFVGLEPVERDRRDRADVQAIDVRRV